MQLDAQRDRIADLARFYRKHLLNDVMPFWEKRTKDTECGGYLTCFDRKGNVTDTDKYIWFQGRQLYMFPALLLNVDRSRDDWRALAKHGLDFILKHAYAGNGRWHYQLDRSGHVKLGTISVFTDLFILGGLCQYAEAFGDPAVLPLIDDTYDALERNVHDPDFKDLFHGTWSPRYRRHGIYMITLHVAGLAEHVLGVERTRPLIDHCLEQILYVFAKDEHELLFESVGHDGSVIDEPEGRVINPGHALESAWFCIEEGRKRGDRSIIERAIRIADWSYRRGYDKECGGIFAYLDARGAEPLQTDWHRETKAYWHDKVWWVHSEALYSLALCAVEADSPEFFWRFLDLHEWCQKHFYDPEYGEWYAELRRDGSPKNTDKGTLWKAAYHLPRALMKTMLLFEQYAQRA